MSTREEDQPQRMPEAEKNIWLKGFRFWLILLCLLVNIGLLASIFLLKSDGCVVCVHSERRTPQVQVKHGCFEQGQGQGIDKIYALQALTDQELVSLLLSEQSVGFGFTQGDVAASLLYARGFDVEPVLKSFSAWPVLLVEVSSTDVKEHPPFKLMSALTSAMRQNLYEYCTTKKAPYQLEYVLNKYKETQDLSFAQDALLDRTDVRTWCAVFQTFSLSQEEAFRTVLFMRPEVIKQSPKELSSKEAFLAAFDDVYPVALAQALVTQYGKECLAFDDPQLEKLIRSLESCPLLLAKFCFRLLQVPRKLAVHELVKKKLALLTHEPRLENMSVEELLVWARKAKNRMQMVSSHTVIPRVEPDKINESIKGVKEAEKNESFVAKPNAICRIYTVKAGDTVWKVAQKFKVDPNKLISLNKLKKGHIDPGQKLKIPNY